MAATKSSPTPSPTSTLKVPSGRRAELTSSDSALAPPRIVEPTAEGKSPAGGRSPAASPGRLRSSQPSSNSGREGRGLLDPSDVSDASRTRRTSISSGSDASSGRSPSPMHGRKAMMALELTEGRVFAEDKLCVVFLHPLPGRAHLNRFVIRDQWQAFKTGAAVRSSAPHLASSFELRSCNCRSQDGR